jgi:DNA-directed RNA polymerase specialized sigma24 family protein
VAQSLLFLEYEAVRTNLLEFTRRIFSRKDASWREDLVDEAVATHLAGLARFDFGSVPSSTRARECMVLYKTVYHLGVDPCRRERARLSAARGARRVSVDGVEGEIEARDLWERYLATPSLTDGERGVLRLHFEEGHTSREAAILLGRSPEAVRKALSRAYRKVYEHHFDGRGDGA